MRFDSPRRRLAVLAAMLALAVPARVRASAPRPGPPLVVRRAAGPIRIDGDLSDPGWVGADSVTTWFETRVGDNVAPQVRNVGRLAYDDRFLYVGLSFEDPEPGKIRAPFGDHDDISQTLDYGGVIIDSRNDGKTAQMFLADARGLQYDAISSDVTGEDSSPDWFWESAGTITATGWTLELRIPFSSLRYGREPNPTWGIILYRNYPRDRRYLFFSARMPRDANCMVCNESGLTGLSGLPHGSHLVLAPYATARQTFEPESGLGSPVRAGRAEPAAGFDLKWSPAAGTAVDATVHPDFSQIESDAAQIVANERFALFFPEKRPFFLEGVDLFATPLNSVYTRTITDPSAGARITGRTGNTSYTVLATQDRGGGSVILPGPQGSGSAPQDFVSDVGIARFRHDLGPSFVSVLATTREIRGGGWNRVVGPDVNWRPHPSESIRGQFLFSDTRTPDRPALADGWNGGRLSDHALQVDWSHTTRTVDWYLGGQDIGPGFRDFNGFMPQVGYREVYTEPGYTLRPQHAFFSRVRLFTTNYVDFDVHERTLNELHRLGIGLDGRLNTFFRVELNQEAMRVGDGLLRRFRPRFYAEAVPGRVLNFVSLEAFVGQEIDFANAREAHGATVNGSVTVRPNVHLELAGNLSRRWIDLPGAAGRLFTAQVERLRTTWQFDPRSFARVIVQYVDTRRDPALYLQPIAGREAALSSSALLAYKLNWQTVVYAGFGDERGLDDGTRRLRPGGNQWFTKVSYAWQR